MPNVFYLDDENIFNLIKQALRETFSMDFGEYSHLGFSSVLLSRIPGIVIALFIGVVIASYATIFNRRIYGAFIRALTNDGAKDPESAKTLAEAGFLKDPAIRSAIRGGHIYKGMLRCPREDAYNAAIERQRLDLAAEEGLSGKKAVKFRADPYKFDFDKDKFYVPEDKVFEAESKFDKKGTGLMPAILITLLSVVMLWAVMKLLPELLQLADNFIGIIGGSEIN